MAAEDYEDDEELYDDDAASGDDGSGDDGSAGSEEDEEEGDLRRASVEYSTDFSAPNAAVKEAPASAAPPDGDDYSEDESLKKPKKDDSSRKQDDSSKQDGSNYEETFDEEPQEQPERPQKKLIARLQDENKTLLLENQSLKAADAARRASRLAKQDLTLEETQEELYEASKKNLEQAELNLALSEKLAAVQTAHDVLKGDCGEAKAMLLDRVAKGSTKAKHVSLLQLVGLLGSETKSLQIDDDGIEKTSKLRTVIAEKNEALAALRAELRLSEAASSSDDVAALKEKATQLLERGRAEKELRARTDDEKRMAMKKVYALSEHVEKLMSHLRHESQAKALSQLELRRCSRELEAARMRTATLLKKNNSREKFALELREGSKILEDQLRLMDRRYLELRAKLDWSRGREKKAKSTASKLRLSLAVATDFSNSAPMLRSSSSSGNQLRPLQSQQRPESSEVASFA